MTQQNFPDFYAAMILQQRTAVHQQTSDMRRDSLRESTHLVRLCIMSVTMVTKSEATALYPVNLMVDGLFYQNVYVSTQRSTSYEQERDVECCIGYVIYNNIPFATMCCFECKSCQLSKFANFGIEKKCFCADLGLYCTNDVSFCQKKILI